MRLFALVGFTYLLTQAAAVCFGTTGTLLCGSICLAVFLVFSCSKKLRAAKLISMAFLTAAIAFGCHAAFVISTIEPLTDLDDKDAIITGTVVENPSMENGKFVYMIRIDEISLKGPPAPEKIRLTTQNALDIDVYDRLKGKIHLYLPNGETGYNSRTSHLSKGIFMSAFLYEYEGYEISPANEKPAYYYAVKLRQKMVNSVFELFPKAQAELISAVLLGYQQELSEQVKSEFRTTGISHIMSVSGLHIATMAQFFLLFFGMLGLSTKKAAFCSIIGIFIFMAVTGFVPSVMRSGIMYLIYLTGIVVGKAADALNSLGVSVFLLCVLNAFAAADIGLLLSFSATLGLILCSNNLTVWMKQKYSSLRHGKAILNPVVSALATTLPAVLFTLPITVLMFGSLSIISPISNFLELVPSTLTMQFSLIAILLYLIPPLSFLSMPFALVAGLLAKYMQNCAEFLSKIPFASVSVSFGYLKLWLAGILLILALVILIKQSKRVRKTAVVISVILLCTGVVSQQLLVCDLVRMTVIQAGDGISVLITKNGQSALIGAGGYSSSSISYELKAQGIRQLDFLQTLGQGDKEYLNTANIIKEFTTKELMVQTENLRNGFLSKSLQYIDTITKCDTTITKKLLDQTITIEVGKFYTGIIYGEYKVLLLTKECDLSLLPHEWKAIDLLVLNQSPDQLEQVSSVVTVYSANDDVIAENIRKITNFGTVVCYTGSSGNIIVDMRPDNLRFRREI